jgi:uncharacterized protein YggE
MDQNNLWKRNKLVIALKVVVAIIILGLFIKVIDHSDGHYGNNEKNARPEITVSGKGEVVAIPDVATFSYSVTEKGKTVKEAQDKATAKSNAVLEFLKKSNISEKDIKTLSYSVNPQYDYMKDQSSGCIGMGCPGKQVLSGYEVSQTIQVRIKDTAQAGTVLTGIGSLNVQNVSGLDLTVDDEDTVIANARTKAIDDAKAKAQVLAKQLGVKLVRITSFTEQGQPVPMYYAKATLDSGVANQAAIAPQIPTGENKVTSNVTITYEIR